MCFNFCLRQDLDASELFFFFNYWRAGCVVLSFIACRKSGVVLCHVSGAKEASLGGSKLLRAEETCANSQKSVFPNEQVSMHCYSL